MGSLPGEEEETFCLSKNKTKQNHSASLAHVCFFSLLSSELLDVAIKQAGASQALASTSQPNSVSLCFACCSTKNIFMHEHCRTLHAFLHFRRSHLIRIQEIRKQKPLEVTTWKWGLCSKWLTIASDLEPLTLLEATVAPLSACVSLVIIRGLASDL